MNSYPRETEEFLAPHIWMDPDQTVRWTGAFSYQITAADARPTSSWVTAPQVDGEYGVWIRNVGPGDLRIWARVSSNPETVVIDCGIVPVG